MNILLCVLTILLTVISFTNGIPYANDYPHHKYSYISGNSNDEREEGADVARTFKNEQLDTGNDLKSAQDVSKFYNTENTSKEHDVNNVKHGSTVDINKHTVGENLETDKSHNRKQVKSGFHNSYSKDETGSNSSYYEDSDDRGGKLVYNKKHKHGDDAYDSKFNDRYRDGVVQDKRDDRFGGYNKRGRQDREHLITENQGDRLINRDGYVRGKGEQYEAYNDQRDYPSRHYLTEERYGINRRYDPSERQFERPIDNIYDRRLDRNVDRLFDPTLESPIRPPLSNAAYRSSVGGYNNLYSSRLPPLSSPPITQTLHKPDDGYFSRRRITIYEDPRELIDPRNDRRGDFMTSSISRHSTVSGGTDDSLYNSPRLEIRPSPLRYRPFDENSRDNLRYRDYK